MSVTLLPPSTIRLLASSQVITSVSSVVKELMENSLDAGATSIEIRLERCGLGKIEVKDDGCGIVPEECLCIALPHYTSKISNFSDLEKLQSYGFRGEALYSLCTVASVTLTTRTAEDDIARAYVFNSSGKVVESKASHGLKGTTVVITGLFNNLPVRKQVMNSGKRVNEELKKVERVVKSLAIIHPRLRVALTHNRFLIWQKTAVSQLKQSVMQIIPHNVVKQLHHLVHNVEQLKLELLIPKRDCDIQTVCMGSLVDSFHLFINKRVVSYKKIEKVFSDIFHVYFGHHLPPNKFPVSFLTITVPSDMLDVNLEPNKTRILIRDVDSILDCLQEQLKGYYCDTDKCAAEAEYSSSCIKTNVKKAVPNTSKLTKDRECLAVDGASEPRQMYLVENDGSSINKLQEPEDRNVQNGLMSSINTVSSNNTSAEDRKRNDCLNRLNQIENKKSVSFIEPQLLESSIQESNQVRNDLESSSTFSSTSMSSSDNRAEQLELDNGFKEIHEIKDRNCAMIGLQKPDSSESDLSCGGTSNFTVESDYKNNGFDSTHSLSLKCNSFENQEDCNGDVSLSQWSRGQVVPDIRLQSSSTSDSLEKQNTPFDQNDCNIGDNHESELNRKMEKVVTDDRIASACCINEFFSSGGKHISNELKLSDVYNNTVKTPRMKQTLIQAVSSEGTVVLKKDMTTLNTDFNKCINDETEIPAFSKFCQEMRSKILKETPGMSFTVVANTLASEWKTLQEKEGNISEKTVTADNMKRKQQTLDNVIHRKKPKLSNYSVDLTLDTVKEKFLKSFPVKRGLDIVSQVELSDLWLYSNATGESGIEIGVLSSTRLLEAYQFYTNKEVMAIPSRILENRIPITESDLGPNLWNILINLENGFDEKLNSRVVTDKRITMNGFNVALSEDSNGHTVVDLTDVAMNINFHGVNDLREILNNIERYGQNCTVTQSRSLNALQYIKSETISQYVKSTIVPLDRASVAKYLNLWWNESNGLNCPHEKQVISPLYKLPN